jgi:hypothetical protein
MQYSEEAVSGQLSAVSFQPFAAANKRNAKSYSFVLFYLLFGTSVALSDPLCVAAKLTADR